MNDAALESVLNCKFSKDRGCVALLFQVRKTVWSVELETQNLNPKTAVFRLGDLGHIT